MALTPPAPLADPGDDDEEAKPDHCFNKWISFNLQRIGCVMESATNKWTEERNAS